MRVEEFFTGNPFASEFDLPPGFLGGVAVPTAQQEEEQEEEKVEQQKTTSSFTPTSGSQNNLDRLGEILAGSGLLSTTIDFGAPALASATDCSLTSSRFISFLTSSVIVFYTCIKRMKKESAIII